MEETVQRVRRMLPQMKADAVLVTDEANIRYISGYTNDTGVLLITDREAYLLTDFRFLFQAQEEAVGFHVTDVAGSSYAKLVSELCEKHGVRKLAFEQEAMTYGDYLGYSKESRLEWVPIPNLLSELRWIKTADELACLREAEHIGDMAFDEILPYLKPGITELEIAARLSFSMRMHGASGDSFPAIVASGVNSSMPHAMPSERKLQYGDFVTMDFGCKYKGYCSDMTRTVVIGKADPKQKEIYETVLRAQTETLAAIRAGVSGKSVDAVARNIIHGAGYEGCFGHGLGHSVGLEIHEAPYANTRDTRLLQPGMLMTVEPGIYVKDFGGVRIEDLVVVTEDGCENLTHSEKKLIEL